MKFFSWIIIWALFMMTEPGISANEPQIRVLICEDLPEIFIQSQGAHILSGSPDGSRIYLPDEESCFLKAAGANVQVILGDGKTFELPSPADIEPASPDAELIIDKGPFDADRKEEDRKLRNYRGHYDVYAKPEGLSIVIELPLEDYLCGVVPAEIGTRSPIEAMKAQAVAARTEAWGALIGERYAGENYDICDHVMCQVFIGTRRINEAVIKSVTETRGLVMFHDGSPIGAYYASSCGGHSENSENVWDARGYLEYCRGVYDGDSAAALDLGNEEDFGKWLEMTPNTYCNPDNPGVPEWGRKKFRWTKEFTAEEMREAVSNARDIGRVKNIVPLARGVSGRLIEVEFKGETGSVKVGPELAIRNLFSPRLTSAAFAVAVEDEGEYPGKFILRGAGSGHGVGMCQFGAMGMAGLGFTFDEILTHFYHGIEIKQVYP